MVTHATVSVLCGGKGPELPPVCGESLVTFDNKENNLTPCEAYQYLFDDLRSQFDVIIYLHDDVTIYDPEWKDKILRLFDNPQCVCAGFGGAPVLGQEGLYKRPYRISDMARSDYQSNQRDWNVHGGHLSGDLRVSVVDAFAMAIRTDFIVWCGGWPVNRLSHHCLDLWMGCEAARAGKEVWVTDVDCMHWGGGTSTKPVYRDAAWLLGEDGYANRKLGGKKGDLVSDHEVPHKWLWEEYRDVLPIRR